ncbi:hypothetical protein GCM10025868_28790 [Angustibacter aerolatus]|uniref:Uncharacterized protein n=1 Tax=Angustibacter aerolatus TaxID=1162965 RepID=A0ABQ6JIF4_9ACTN|nr:hypothetical protein GCM10025868_28790 [Angustibacter aerolatus]
MPGLRSRCTTPAAWIAVSAPVSPRPRRTSLVGSQRAALAHHGVEAGTGHEPGDDVRLLAVDVGVEHLGHQRVPHPAQRHDLAGQPGTGVGVVRDVRPQHLDGDGPPALVEAEVHDAHAALAEQPAQAVRPQPRVVPRHAHDGTAATCAAQGADDHRPLRTVARSWCPHERADVRRPG